jgi:hypothetical protein
MYLFNNFSPLAYRQNVRMAAETLSSSVAQSMEMLFPDDIEMKESAQFIRLMDSWFDCFNCYKKTDHVKWAKSAYGTNLEKSNALLEEVISVITNLKVRTKRVLMYWQEAIIGGCHALMQMYLVLHDDGFYEIEFIITSR